MKSGKFNWVYWIFPLAGTIFCLYYIQSAVCDVVYDDYIRLVNSYLPDVWNPAKFWVPDLLTRIPVNYLGRIVNVLFFDYSTLFDMALGVLSLGASGFLVMDYCRRQKMGAGVCILSMAVIFSLNKWEMLTNGSGWSHFLAFTVFYYHYLVLDRVACGREKAGDRRKLVWLPFVATLGLAGPYCAVYTGALLLAYGFCMWSGRRETGRWDLRYLSYGVCAALPVFLYMWSNSYAVYEHAGATSQPFLYTLMDVPSFFARFFVKSFSSMVLGEEVMTTMVSTNLPVFLLGLTVMAAYGAAFWLNISRGIYRRTLFPLICVAAGVMNHALILLSRWIFLRENYGMSSRYALQYQIGILGILLTFGLAFGGPRKREYAKRTAAALFGLLILAGNLYTSWRELEKAPYRKVYYEERAAAALEFESLDDDTLKKVFDYRKNEEGSGAAVRRALTTLKEHGWNVYGEEKTYESSNSGGRIGNPDQ